MSSWKKLLHRGSDWKRSVCDFSSNPDADRGWLYVDPIVQAYVSWMDSQLEPALKQHGGVFVSWAVSTGHLRRITEELDTSRSPSVWRQVSTRMERWSSSEQVFPASDAMRKWFDAGEWRRLRDKWGSIFEENGGAMGEGVSVVDGAPGARRRTTLKIDMEVKLFSV